MHWEFTKLLAIILRWKLTEGCLFTEKYDREIINFLISSYDENYGKDRPKQKTKKCVGNLINFLLSSYDGN
jgi:hypothetical protein